MNYLVYTLSDPINNKIRYVGITTQSLNVRLSKHLFRVDQAKNRRCNWIKSLKNKGLKPVIELLDTAYCMKDLQELEMYWIAQMKAWGFDIVNSTMGGEGSLGYKHTPESIEKMRAANALRKRKPIKNKMTKEEQYDLLAKRHSVKIIEYSSNGHFLKVWDSVKEATKHYGIKENNIIHVLKGRNRIANNSMWTYYTNDFPKKIEPPVPHKNRRKITVYDVIDNKEYFFKNLSLAFEFTGRPTSINKIVNTEKLFKKRFKYADI